MVRKDKKDLIDESNKQFEPVIPEKGRPVDFLDFDTFLMPPPKTRTRGGENSKVYQGNPLPAPPQLATIECEHENGLLSPLLVNSVDYTNSEYVDDNESRVSNIDRVSIKGKPLDKTGQNSLRDSSSWAGICTANTSSTAPDKLASFQEREECRKLNRVRGVE